MRKAGVALLAAVLAGWLLLQAGRPRGSPVTSASDYPLEEGLRWTYRGAGNFTVVREIERSVEIDGRAYREMKYELPLLGTRTLPMRQEGGSVVTPQGGKEHLLLRFPMLKGDSWTIDLPSEKEIARCTVLGAEVIEFEGRKASATRLEVRREARDGRPISVDSEWYAPGVGLVRMEVTVGLRATFVLESFGRR